MQKKSQYNWIMASAALISVLGAGGLAGTAIAREEAPRVYAVGAGAEPYVVQLEGEDRAYLGVTLEEETDWAEGGARITRVVDDSPAAGAGLQQGDIIVRFDGETIRGPLALTKAIHETEPGESVTLTVVRDGREQKFEIEMGERASLWRQSGAVVAPEWTEDLKERMEEMGESMGRAFTCAGDDCTGFMLPCEGEDCKDSLRWAYRFDSDRPVLGVELVEVTPELRRHLGAGDDRGVLVGKVLSGTPAEQAGIRVGDLIVSVGGVDVGDTGDLRGALRDKRGESFTVELIREKSTVRVDVKIPEPERERPTGPRAARAPRAPAVAALPRIPPPPPPTPTAMAGPTPEAPPAPPGVPAEPSAVAPPAPVAVPAPRGSRLVVEARRADMEALRQAELATNLQEARYTTNEARAAAAQVLDEARQQARMARTEVQRALELSRSAQAEARSEVRRALDAERQALREARSWMREVI